VKYNFKAETDTAKLPTRHTEYSAGVDFYSDTDVLIYPGKSEIISTGISWKPNTFVERFGEYENICLVIQSRSGIAFKNDIEASNAGKTKLSLKSNSITIVLNVFRFRRVIRSVRVFLSSYQNLQMLKSSMIIVMV